MGSPPSTKFLDEVSDASRVGIALDGFGVSFYTNQAAEYLYLHNLAFSLNYLKDHCQITWNNGTGDSLCSVLEDPAIKWRIAENSERRVVVEVFGNFYTTTYSQYVTNSTSVKITYTIYPTWMTKRVEWVRSGNVTLVASGDEFENCLASALVTGGVTNADGYYESSGSEVDGAEGTYNSAKYLLERSDELDILLAVLDENLGIGTDLFQFLYNGSSPVMAFDSSGTTLSSGTTDCTFLFVFDCAYRYAGSKQLSEANRIAIGNAAADQVGPAISGGFGAILTDSLIPLHLSSGFCTDDAQQVENDGDSIIKLAVDIDRRYHSFLVDAKDCFLVGDPSSPTQLLISHFPCEDNAASTTIVDAMGNYDGTLSGGDNTSVLHNTDSERSGGSLLTNGTDDFLNLSACIAGLTNKNKGTFLVRAKSNFTITPGADKPLFTFYYSSNDNLYIYYVNSSNVFRLTGDINGTPQTGISSSAYSANVELQNFIDFLMAFDITQGFVLFAIDGEVIGIEKNSATGWGTNPNSLYAGSYPSSYSPYYLDDIKVLNGCIVPFGAVFTDEANSFANPHESILFHEPLDNLSETSPAIGSGSISVSGSPSLSSGPFGDNGMLFDANGEIVTLSSSGNIINTRGLFDFWFKSTASFNDNVTHMIFGTLGASFGTGEIFIGKNSSNLFYFNIYANGSEHYLNLNGTDFANYGSWTDWNHFRCFWDSEEKCYATDTQSGMYMGMIINGKKVEYSGMGGITSGWTPDSLASTFGIGNDPQDTTHYAGGVIKNFTFTNDPYTPKVWTNLGVGPLLLKQARVS